MIEALLGELAVAGGTEEFLLAGADYLRRSRSEEINARRV